MNAWIVSLLKLAIAQVSKMADEKDVINGLILDRLKMGEADLEGGFTATEVERIADVIQAKGEQLIEKGIGELLN